MGRFMITNSAAKTPWNTGYTDKKKGTKKVFDCLFCEAATSVDVKLNRKDKIGSLKCRKCQNEFQCAITHLDSEVDVYANWIDACEAVAKKEVEKVSNEPTENERRTEAKEKAEDETPKPVAKKRSIGIESTKPTSKKRKLDAEAPKPATKRSKLNDIPTEKKPTNLTKTASTKRDSAMPPRTFSARNDAQSKTDLELAIERDREGREAEVEAEAQRKAALAKEMERLEVEGIRRWREVATAAVAAAAVMMERYSQETLPGSPSSEKPWLKQSKNEETSDAVASDVERHSHDSLFGSSSDEATIGAQPEKKGVTTDPATTEDISHIYDTLLGSPPDDSSMTNIFDVPTPIGSPKSNSSHSEQPAELASKIQESAIALDGATIEASKTTEKVRIASRDSLFGISLSDQQVRSNSEHRRNCLDSRFGSSG